MLALLTTTLEADEAKAEARRLVELARGSRAIIGLLSTIIVYKFSNLSRDEVDEMLGIELQQTRVYQEAKAEGETIGEVRGEARGLQRGRTEEGQALVLRLLTRKLGQIAPDVRSRVNSLTIDRIESLGEALLDFTQMGDLLTWLDDNEY